MVEILRVTGMTPSEGDDPVTAPAALPSPASLLGLERSDTATPDSYDVDLLSGSARVHDSDLGQLRRVLIDVKRAVKQAMFNRHRPEQFAGFIAPAHGLLSAFLELHHVCELRIDVSTLSVGATPLFEDDSAELNLVYPLWAAGVRLLIFKRGISPDELLRFFMLVVDQQRGTLQEDLATVLWRADFLHIEWVAVESFSLGAQSSDADDGDVEVAVDEILSYVQGQLRLDADGDPADGLAFARVGVDDAALAVADGHLAQPTLSTHIARDVVSRADKQSLQFEWQLDERVLLSKAANILLEVLRVPSTDAELADIEVALEQLLDGLLLDGHFTTIDRVVEQCEAIAQSPEVQNNNREQARKLSESLQRMMHEGQRIRSLGASLNTGRTKDIEGLRRYLLRLGPTVTLLLLDLLDTLQSPQHRRLICDVLVEVGEQGIPMFARRLPLSSSNLAKDLMYIIDKINPPNKVELFAPILRHDNAVLRMEGLSVISQTKSKACHRIIEDVFRTHPVPQMRAHAARLLAEFPAEWSEFVLINAAKDAHFVERPEGEQRAIYAAIIRLESEPALGFIAAIFLEKSTLFSKKVDDKKRSAIHALAQAPGMQALQILADVAKDDKLHSKDVAELAKRTALDMRTRLLGPA